MPIDFVEDKPISKIDFVEDKADFVEGTPYKDATGAYNLSVTYNKYKPKEVQKHAWWHPILSALPIGGAIGGELLGIPTGGLASGALAGIGASGGETLKQAIEKATGQRSSFDPQQIALEGAMGATGVGVGKLIGKGFTKFAPNIAETMANIPRADFARLTNKIHRGDKIFKKDSLEEAKMYLDQVAEESTEHINTAQLTEDIDKVLDYFGGHNINPTKDSLSKELTDINKSIKASQIPVNPQGQGAVNSLAQQDIELYNSLVKDYGEDTARNAFSKMGQDIPVVNEGMPSSGLTDFYDVHRLKQEIGAKAFPKNNVADQYQGQQKEALQGIYGALNNTLREANPLYKGANEAILDIKAEKSFRGLMPRYAGMYAGKKGLHGLLAGGATAGAGLAFKMGNPLMVIPELLMVSSMSPATHKNALRLYQSLYNKGVGSGTGAWAGNVFSPTGTEYTNALKDPRYR